LILAWWLYVQQNNAVLANGHTEQDQAATAGIQRIFEEIMNELDEQGVSYNPSGAPRLDPIDFYTSLLNNWVWKCCGVIEDRLRCFKERMQP
jgi:hypothetical protein